ncbi:endothelin-converting enzyme 1-like [Pomacea canaliculata]|uniref:endothelin-converting enzyme 1-like n=1 Tax=Pomacea canaliculata TaxID=400727 RepID=UPI000D731E9E|nr:endothelin-converting enzyme 1-like [Pomacea canaliculata]
MGRKIGYPEFVLDDTALNAKSDKYFVNEDDFFGTSLDILVERTVYALQNLGRQEYRTEWSMPIYSVNAFYNPYVNEIVFPAGILTLPILVKNFTTAELYGNLGTVIAHEISHSFHGTGADFDEKGNLSQWWGQKDLKIFQNRSQCLVDQYNKFVDKEMNLHVDGSLTLDENIADNCALKQAFKAYRSVIKERGREEDQHPSLPYTPDQLFFIGFAQAWCSNYGPELRKVVMMNDHSPNNFRVIGSIQNNKDFGRVFNCPVGKPMNPKHKCEVW